MDMILSSHYLDAFVGVARAGSFSKASKSLHVTQSALSQRIKNLEDELSLTLFLRTSAGIQLTEQGQKLLRYCETKNSLEQELFEELSMNHKNELSGTLRIGTYSTIFRSVIMPSLKVLLQKNPNLLCEFHSCHMGELPAMLNRGEVDFIVMDYKLDKSSVESELLGKEKIVVIESQKKSERSGVFLDNNHSDQATEFFFKNEKSKPLNYKRSYFDDCYGIIEGVEMGLGRAVMSSHLVKNNKKIKISKDFKEQSVEVYLHYHAQPFYSKVHQAIVRELKSNVGDKYL